MTIKSAPYFWAICDCCGARAEYGDYAAWADEDQARDYSEAGFEHIGNEDLCGACWAWPEDTDGYDEATWEGTDDPVRRHPVHTNGSHDA
jgi:hypothetical protein